MFPDSFIFFIFLALGSSQFDESTNNGTGLLGPASGQQSSFSHSAGLDEETEVSKKTQDQNIGFPYQLPCIYFNVISENCIVHQDNNL